ncbi:MAG TPA: TonB-dependent receptor [Thiobacillaceae bacterium]|nr:TonB-dependent receptor [Thiobacillaceae bacterium]
MHQTLLTGAVCLVASLCTVAQAEQTYTLDDILVTASRYPAPQRDAPIGTSLIDRDTIEAHPGRSLPELLATQAGIQVRDLFGNQVSGSTVDLRGMGAVAAQNALVLVDGRPLNDWDLSGVVWSAIPPESVERLEIIRGSQAVLYGAGATTGVINIVTRAAGPKPQDFTATATLGGYGTRALALSGGLSVGENRISLAASSRTADGYRANGESEQHNLFAHLRRDTEQGEVGLRLLGDRLDLRLPGARQVQPSAGVDQMSTDRRGAATPLDWSLRDGWQAGAYGRWRAGAGEWLLDAGYRAKQQDAYYDFGGFPDYREARLGVWTLAPRYRMALGEFGIRHDVLVGLDLQHWDYALDVSNAPANVSQPINRVDAWQRQTSLYIRDSITVTPDFQVTVGARREQMHVSANEVYDPTAPGAFPGSAAPAGEQNAWQHAWEVGLRWDAAPTTSLHLRLGRSYRFATVDEIYEYSPVLLSQEFQFLRPQTSRDLELGAQWRNSGRTLRASLFHMRVRDEIHLDPYASGIGNTNLPPLRRQGVELESSVPVGPATLRAGYTLTEAEFLSGTMKGLPLAGRRVPLVPLHRAVIGLEWPLDGATRMGVDLRFLSSQYMDNDETNSFYTRIPAHTVADLRLQRRLGDWRLGLDIRNLLDRKYYEYAVRSQFVADRFNAYPLPERHVLLTLEWKPKQPGR